MSYRGEDLDLRTPPGISPAPAEPLAQADSVFVGNGRRERSHQVGGQASSSPIWVDDIVLDCCNYAYDVALAHRSAEVRLEHLLYALTRIEAAAEVLESRGIRVAAMRRDAVTTISTDIPIGLPPGGTPRRSEALEDALRVAANNAYRRQKAVGVGDILFALLESGLDVGGLQRARPFVQRSGGASLFDSITADGQQDRVRVPYFGGEASRPAPADVPTYSGAPSGGPQGGSRLDVLENAVRTLIGELSNERKIFSGALHDLQRELMAQREETSRLGDIPQDKFQALFGDRLESIEQSLLTQPSSASEIEGLHERVATLERTIRNEIAEVRSALDTLLARPEPTVADVSPLTHRLDVIEEAVLSRETADRLKAIEDGFTAERDRSAAAHETASSRADALSGVLGRLPSEVTSVIQAALTEQTNGFSNALAGAASRTETADARTHQELGLVNETLNKLGEIVTDDLAEIHDGLAKVTNNQHALATALELQKQDVDKSFGHLAARLESLELASERPVEMLEAVHATVERMNKLAIEKHTRRNRFWYWLFGTDDWLAASWPSQTSRIARELAALKSPER